VNGMGCSTNLRNRRNFERIVIEWGHIESRTFVSISLTELYGMIFVKGHIQNVTLMQVGGGGR